MAVYTARPRCLPGGVAKRRRASAAPSSSTFKAVDAGLAVVAALTVALVALYFSRDVNRVFDIPKAFALKMGGCIALLGWLLVAATDGVRFQGTRVLLAPVLAFVGAVGLSTLTSIDPWMSFNGVYERQFGFQGYLACAGLYLAASAGLAGRRGALAGFGFLAALGSVVGAYALVQSAGADPFGFFEAPDDKTFSFLGNANFAGNSLALVFPLVVLLAAVAVGRAFVLDGSEKEKASGSPAASVAFGLFGFVGVLGLQLSPLGFDDVSPESYVVTLCLSMIFPLAGAMAGSLGPEALRASTAASRRNADGLLAGAMIAFVFCVVAGIVAARTRGSWIGSAAAVVGGFVLLPNLFADQERRLKQMRIACWGSLGVVLVVSSSCVVLLDNVYTRTIRSIPAAFDPESVKYGAGQGTRPYLWLESPRVLMHHEETLERMKRDLAFYEEKVAGEELGPVPIPELGPEDAPNPGWREGAVWLSGIGIETYRYAFMSHKSKRLEALDPMTNHDNPHNNYLYIAASLGLIGTAAYLWLLAASVFQGWRVFNDRRRSRTDRALAFGLLTSFMSYSVYSVGGFDSVASSVFLFFMLGAAAVLYAGEVEARRQRLFDIVPGPPPVAVLTSGAVVLLCGATMIRVNQVRRADQAFVGDGRRRDFAAMIDDAEEAIRRNPGESYYRQHLGQLLMQRAVGLMRKARQLRSKNQNEEAIRYAEEAKATLRDAETALFSALNHAWAPENIFISAYQMYSQLGLMEEAAEALEQTLDHSPHLAPIRTSLAALRLQSGQLEAAEMSCQWALDIDPESGRAHTVCAQVALQEERLDDARYHVKRALRFRPDDPAAKQLLEQVKARNATVAAESG